MLALALQRARLGEVELDGEDADVAGAHGRQADSSLGSAARRRRRRLVEVGALDLARLVDLEDVAFLDVVEALEQDAALEALRDLADVVLEALELSDRRLVDDACRRGRRGRCAFRRTTPLVT